VGIKGTAAEVSLPCVFDADPHWHPDRRAGTLSNGVTQGSANDAAAVNLNHGGDERNRDARIAATHD
jgi:hypothetical protein